MIITTSIISYTCRITGLTLKNRIITQQHTVPHSNLTHNTPETTHTRTLGLHVLTSFHIHPESSHSSQRGVNNLFKHGQKLAPLGWHDLLDSQLSIKWLTLISIQTPAVDLMRFGSIRFYKDKISQNILNRTYTCFYVTLGWIDIQNKMVQK